MVKKRGLDNIYERNKKRTPSLPVTPSSNQNETKNTLNDTLLNLYKQEIVKFKEKDGVSSSDEKVTKNEACKNSAGASKNKPISEEINAIQSNTPTILRKKAKKNNEAFTPKNSTINFDNVGGMDDILEELLYMFIHLKIPHLHSELGSKPVRGILLQGPSGCGKTHLVRALAGELKIPYFELASTELVSGISGQTESKIRDIFDEAILHSPCILFIDEIDAISTKRENATGGMEQRMVTQLLKSLDELNEKDVSHGVMVIGATNIPDSIDPAMRRGGRFDRELAIGIPNENARKEILQVLCKKLKLSPGFDLQWIAHHTPGYVGADLQSLISKAVELGTKRILRGNEIDKYFRENISSNLTRKFPLSLTREWFKNVSMTEEEIEKVHFELEDFKVALQNFTPYCKREGFASVPDVTWEDIGALDDVKKELRSLVLRPVKNAKFYEDNKLTVTKGILLYGPKGCGKTQLAKALANECNINFLCVNGPELLSMYLGESEKAVRRVFQRARYSAPCVIFFDEFDALCPSRSISNSNAAAERVVNQLLTEMDGMQERKQVFVMAATNRIEKIDSAMLRPGRLEKLIYVDLPTPSGRIDILKSLTRNKTKIAEDLSFDTIAFDERCTNFSGADLAYLISEATAKAVDEWTETNHPPSSNFALNISHFDKALEVVQPSFSEQDRKYFEKYRRPKSNS